MLDLAREEGPGNKELGDLMRIDIPLVNIPLFFVFKVCKERKLWKKKNARSY
jgi:hypothetical protein